MSRIGKAPIAIPNGVEIKLEGNKVSVKGPKGELALEHNEYVTCEIVDKNFLVNLSSGNEKENKFQGLYRSLVNNMVIGVTDGFVKELEMVGVGFRAAVQGNLLDLQVGFSHPTKVEIPAGLKVEVEKNVNVKISGTDKQQVGQFAAEIRATRPPEPYKGKGIR
jgi:large subunit ribosomal protein L6